MGGKSCEVSSWEGLVGSGNCGTLCGRGEGTVPGGLNGALSVSLRRAVPFMLVSNLLMVESPERPAEKGLGKPERVEMVGEGSKPDFTGV